MSASGASSPAPAGLARKLLPSLAAITLMIALRIPMFGVLNIYMDEHTFLNMAADVLEGNLPYLHLWDNKPPLLFLLLAPLVALANQEFWVIRLAAALLDAMTALLAKKCADRFFGPHSVNWLVAFWTFLVLTRSAAGGALMSETVVLPMLLGALLIFSSDRSSWKHFFFAGLLLGMATLVRFLPGIAAAALVITIFLRGILQQQRQLVWNSVAAGLGGLVTLVLIALPYLIVGEGQLLIASAILAPLAYAGAGGESLSDVLIHGSKGITATIVIGALGAISPLVLRSVFPLRDRAGYMLFLIMFGSLMLMILGTGMFWAHYLILALPFCTIGLAPLFQKCLTFAPQNVARAGTPLAVVAIIFLTLSSTVRLGKEYQPMKQTRDYLAANMQAGESLYLTTDYGLYWLLDRTPPHPLVTHAGNIFRSEIFGVLPYEVETSGELMSVIMARKPTWIVFADRFTDRYAEDTEVGRVLHPALRTHYALQPSPDQRSIYKLKD